MLPPRCRSNRFTLLRRENMLLAKFDCRLLWLFVLVCMVVQAFSLLGHFDPLSGRASESTLSLGEDELLKEAQGHFKPLPKDMGTAKFPTTPDRVELGRMLFFDPRMSVDGTVSCARCHLPSLYATDGL